MNGAFMNYIECDLADGERLVEWRRARVAKAPRRRRLRTLMRRVSPLVTV